MKQISSLPGVWLSELHELLQPTVAVMHNAKPLAAVPSKEGLKSRLCKDRLCVYCSVWLCTGTTRATAAGRWQSSKRIICCCSIKRRFLMSSLQGSSLCVVFGCLYYTSNNSRQVAEFKQNHPLLVMLVSLTAGYYLILQVSNVS